MLSRLGRNFQSISLADVLADRIGQLALDGLALEVWPRNCEEVFEGRDANFALQRPLSLEIATNLRAVKTSDPQLTPVETG